MPTTATRKRRKNRANKQTEFQIAEYQYLDRKHMIEIADNCDRWDFNRQLDPEKVRTITEDQAFPIIYSFVHQHRRMVRCEDHIRLVFETPDSMGACDVPTEYADALPQSIGVKANGSLVAVVLLDDHGKPSRLRYRRMCGPVRRALRWLAANVKDRRVATFIGSKL